MNHQIVLETLKRALKKKKLTYKALSEEIGMSESGLKKLLSAKDISLNRLIQITNAIGVSFPDIIEMAHKEEVRTVKLTESQEKALMSDKTLLRIFWRVAVENKSQEEIIKAEKVDFRTLSSKLLKLENLDLIKITKNGKINSIHQGLYRWLNDTDLVKQINYDWSLSALKKSLKNPSENFHQLSYFQLSPKSKMNLTKKLQEINDEYARISRLERINFSDADLEPVTFTAAIASSGPLD